jgi:hypothetical protein
MASGLGPVEAWQILHRCAPQDDKSHRTTVPPYHRTTVPSSSSKADRLGSRVDLGLRLEPIPPIPNDKHQALKSRFVPETPKQRIELAEEFIVDETTVDRDL